MWIRNPRQCRAGATAVEFAIVGPVFLVLLLGIIEFSRAYMVTALLTDGARRGCRQAIIEGTSTSAITNTVVNYLQSAGISGENVSVIINDGNGNIVEASTVPAYTELTVKASIPVSTVTWLPAAGMYLFCPNIAPVTDGQNNVTGYQSNDAYAQVGPSATLSYVGTFTMRRE